MNVLIGDIGGTKTILAVYSSAAANLTSTFNWPSVTLLNDLESVGYAVSILRPEAIHTLNPGEPVPGGNVAGISKPDERSKNFTVVSTF